MTPMPDDVRAKIIRLFPERETPEQVRAKALAATAKPGRMTTAHLLAGLEAKSPELAAYARWILKTGANQVAALDSADDVRRDMVTSITSLRLMNVHRELKQLGTYLNENPGDTHSQERVAELITYIREAERSAPGAVRAWQAELRKEGAREGRTRG